LPRRAATSCNLLKMKSFSRKQRQKRQAKP